MSGANTAFFNRATPAIVNKTPIRHRPILIAGLPRSGTSMTMRVLAEHGVWTGKTMEATAANPRGFFENLTLKNGIIKKLLSDLGADPNGVDPLPDIDNLPILPGLGDRIINRIFQEGYDTKGPWAFKDPKLTLLWPVLAQAFPQAHWIIPTRNRADVIRSLTRTSFMRRHSTDPEYWAMFCASYDQRLEALEKSGAKVTRLDTNILAQGDYGQLSSVLEDAGITPQAMLFQKAIEPSLFGRKDS